MLSGLAEFVVQGITTEGAAPQPPGWIPQLLDKLAGNGPQRVIGQERRDPQRSLW